MGCVLSGSEVASFRGVHLVSLNWTKEQKSLQFILYGSWNQSLFGLRLCES